MFSIIGRIADDKERVKGVSGKRSCYSAQTFLAKVSYSFGRFFLGNMIIFFRRAVPGKSDADLILEMDITAGPTIAPAVIASPLIYSHRALTPTKTGFL